MNNLSNFLEVNKMDGGMGGMAEEQTVADQLNTFKQERVKKEVKRIVKVPKNNKQKSLISNVLGAENGLS